MVISSFKLQMVREAGVDLPERYVTSADKAVAVARQYLEHADRECLIVIALDAKNRIVGINTACQGTIDQAVVYAREVFKFALLANSAGIMVAHNHPTGHPQPSGEDSDSMEKLAHAGTLLGVRLVDWFVIGETGYYSHQARRVQDY